MRKKKTPPARPLEAILPPMLVAMVMGAAEHARDILSRGQGTYSGRDWEALYFSVNQFIKGQRVTGKPSRKKGQSE